VRIAAAVEPDGGDGLGRCVVRVEDTGRGIPAHRLDQLFAPFSRLGAEQTEVEGTGLGLALSQRLTEAMGGVRALAATGPPGGVFPVGRTVGARPLARLAAPVAAAVAAHPDAAAHGPARLLYVEDNLANLSLVETILLTRPKWRTLPALQGNLG